MHKGEHILQLQYNWIILKPKIVRKNQSVKPKLYC